MFLLGLILFPCASLVATVSAEWETPRRPKPLPQRGNGVPHTVRPQRNPYFSNQNINIYPQITGSPPQTKRPHCNNRRSRPSDKTRTSQVFRMDLSDCCVYWMDTHWFWRVFFFCFPKQATSLSHFNNPHKAWINTGNGWKIPDLKASSTRSVPHSSNNIPPVPLWPFHLCPLTTATTKKVNVFVNVVNVLFSLQHPQFYN